MYMVCKAWFEFLYKVTIFTFLFFIIIFLKLIKRILKFNLRCNHCMFLVSKISFPPLILCSFTRVDIHVVGHKLFLFFFVIGVFSQNIKRRYLNEQNNLQGKFSYF